MLAEQLQSELTTAMKARDEITMTVLRSAIAAIKEARVAGDSAVELTDQQVETAIAREAKKRDEAAAAFESAGRTEQAERERAEGRILARYLPTPLTDDELEAIVSETLTGGGFSGPTDLGAAMKATVAAVAGRRDGGAVSALVRAKLGK